MKNQKRINLRFSSEEWERLDVERQRRRTHWQTIGERFFRQWLAEGRSGGAIPVSESPPGYSKAHQHLHDLLDMILKHGGQRDKIGIERNLEWGAKYLGEGERDVGGHPAKLPKSG